MHPFNELASRRPSVLRDARSTPALPLSGTCQRVQQKRVAFK